MESPKDNLFQSQYEKQPFQQEIVSGSSTLNRAMIQDTRKDEIQNGIGGDEEVQLESDEVKKIQNIIKGKFKEADPEVARGNQKLLQNLQKFK